MACKIATCSASQQSEVRGWHRHALVAVAVAGHEHALLSFCSLHPPPSPLSPLSPCPAGVLIRPQLIRCGGRMKGLAQNNCSAGDTPPPPSSYAPRHSSRNAILPVPFRRVGELRGGGEMLRCHACPVPPARGPAAAASARQHVCQSTAG